MSKKKKLEKYDVLLNVQGKSFIFTLEDKSKDDAIKRLKKDISISAYQFSGLMSITSITN